MAEVIGKNCFVAAGRSSSCLVTTDIDLHAQVSARGCWSWLQGSFIGEGKSFPDNSLIGGNPAKRLLGLQTAVAATINS